MLDRSHLSRKVLSSLFNKDKLFNKMTDPLTLLSRKDLGETSVNGKVFLKPCLRQAKIHS